MYVPTATDVIPLPWDTPTRDAGDDMSYLVPGGMNNCFLFLEEVLLRDYPRRDELLPMVRNGVSV